MCEWRDMEIIAERERDSERVERNGEKGTMMRQWRETGPRDPGCFRPLPFALSSFSSLVYFREGITDRFQSTCDA